MEAAPRLPMLFFDPKICPENIQFGPKLKPYIANFYNEDPESYLTEIYNLESLRGSATHPTMDISGVQLLKKYYCQLHFLKSRFPMEEGQPCAIQFVWKDPNGVSCETSDIRFELMTIMYNIGALHTYLGSLDSRGNPEGMKMACTHFQCAAWAFQSVKEKYSQFIFYITSVELVHFFQQICLAQAQECILEKSMLDNRKPSIIAKVAVQVYDYYRQSLVILQSTNDEICGRQNYKEWTKYLHFKIAYHKCISLLFQGQQAEEQQKMGERVAFYQAACEYLEEARKLTSNFKNNQKELLEALSFTVDVVEGKRKAAKNENEFIYHEEVPALSHLQEVKGASLVKGIPFNVNDTEVSGPDIFARLVPMEAHEASSLYSEKKAQMLRQMGELVEINDQALAEFMSSMQLDLLTKMHQATGIPQELVDRAAALSARPSATKDLIEAMGKLSNIYQDVESNLNEIDVLLKEEEENEKKYQEFMGKRPPSIIATDLSRECAKYKEAHTKANESNQTLHRAMTTHVANLKILQQPLRQLQQQLPSVELPNPNIDEKELKELEILNAKVEEMRTQRAMLWAQLREAVHKDDITASLVTKPPNQSLEELFGKELEKHQQLASLIEQNVNAQENIKKAFVDAYARAINTRRYIQDVIQKRNSTILALIASYDSYEDLLAKANKGIEFYTKLETNVSKLLQRIKSSCKVQQEEREQMLIKNDLPKQNESSLPVAPSPAVSTTPKLKDYLDARKKAAAVTYPDASLQYQAMNYGVNVPQNPSDTQTWPPAVRPAPLGSEVNSEPNPKMTENPYNYSTTPYNYGQLPAANMQYSSQNTDTYLSQYPNSNAGYSSQVPQSNVEDLSNRMNYLLSKPDISITPASQYNPQYSYSSYIPQNYAATSYAYSTQTYNNSTQAVPSQNVSYDPSKAYTSTTNSFQPISSYMNSSTHMQYPDSSLSNAASGSTQTTTNYSGSYQYQNPSGAGYQQQITDNNMGYQQQTQTDTQSANAVNYQQPNAGVSVGYQQQTQTTSQGVVYPQQGTPQPSYSVENSYYPPGYSPNYNTSQASTQNIYSTPQKYHTQEYATSVQPDLSNYNYSVYSSPVTDMSNSQSRESNYMSASVDQNGTVNGYPSYAAYSASYVPQATNSSQGSYENYGQNYYTTPSTQSYPSTAYGQQNISAVPQSVAQPSTNVASIESNVDLLSGLDFSISQAPLQPQPNVQPKVQESNIKPAVSENKINPSNVTVKKEPKVEVKTSAINILPSKSLNNKEVRELFNQELGKYEKYVETLTNKTLSGPTNLDLKWKEIQDKQDCDSQKKIISVARCYPMKNRFADILPYDYSRVELKDAKDDYINASFVREISPYAPQFIVTQAPLASTFADFWTMIKEQQVELIFCLLNDSEIGDDVYFPREKGKNLNISNMVLSLQSVIVKSNWTERLISVTLPEKRESWVVMHVQFTSWPGSLFPTTPEPFLSYVLELINLHQQQRCATHPIVVHCSSGIGRSGLVCLLTAAFLDATNNATSIPDLAALTLKLTSCKKNILRDREHLKFAYEAFLCYMKQLVSQDKMKKKLNELVPKQEEKKQPSNSVVETKDTNIDPLSSLDPFWANKK